MFRQGGRQTLGKHDSRTHCFELMREFCFSHLMILACCHVQSILQRDSHETAFFQAWFSPTVADHIGMSMIPHRCLKNHNEGSRLYQGHDEIMNNIMNELYALSVGFLWDLYLDQTHALLLWADMSVEAAYMYVCSSKEYNIKCFSLIFSVNRHRFTYLRWPSFRQFYSPWLTVSASSVWRHWRAGFSISYVDIFISTVSSNKFCVHHLRHQVNAVNMDNLYSCI